MIAQPSATLTSLQIGAVHEITPLVFLAAEEVHRDRQATEALFLTYNADLAFVEARLLGICHASGATVTVIADADMWNPDVRSVRYAGRQYHAGLVASGGAFHPKLSVLVGAERAVAIIGSGNLTLGGWQYNAELATVLTADKSAAPRAMADLHELLDSLTECVRLDPVAFAAVQRCARALEGLMRTATVSDTGHRLVASWGGAIMEQLPQGPVDQLLLTAPFHDPASGAVRHLLKRLSPREVTIAVQPGWTALNPVNLKTVLADYAKQTSAKILVIRDEEDPETNRYRHGKLIEWSVDGKRFAMTGSPNLSLAALTFTAGNSGNYELAVIGLRLSRSSRPGNPSIFTTCQLPGWKPARPRLGR